MSTFRARPAPAALAAGRAAAPTATQAPEVIVVTLDAELEHALRAASPVAMRVATTPAALADLLMNGEAGALVLDISALDAAALTVTRHLAEQFPDVPLVAVGYREDEARLAGLISRGLVYRFLHRPVSPARARNFIEAALRRSGEIGSGARLAPSRTADPASARAPARHRSLLALVVGGAVIALGLGFWLALKPPASPPAAPPAAAPAPASGAVERLPAAVAIVVPAAPAAVAATTVRRPIATAPTAPVTPATAARTPAPTPPPAAIATLAPEPAAAAGSAATDARPERSQAVAPAVAPDAGTAPVPIDAADDAQATSAARSGEPGAAGRAPPPSDVAEPKPKDASGADQPPAPERTPPDAR